ncbi:MAG: RHS repeat-associated core domain-containing protein [Bacteroides fragilis]
MYHNYYYDTETGFYYLQSRYYDPVTHRFINADTYASTNPTNAIAYNLFAYCNNNPVMRLDSSGKISFAFSLGFTFNLFGFGGSISISLVSTDNDLGMQYSYYLSDDKDTSTQTIGFDVGPCVGVQITEKESIKELEGLMRATGGDAVFGCDILTDTNGKYVGWAIGSSLISNNMHSTISQTKTIWKVKRWDWIDAVFDLLGVKLQ